MIIKNTRGKIATGLAAMAMLATGGMSLAAGTAQADPPPQRPVTGKTLLQKKDVQRVFPSYTSMKSRSSTVAGKDHLSTCTGNDNLKDFLPIDTTQYGAMSQTYEQERAIRITQQAAFDGTDDSSAHEAVATITAALDECVNASNPGRLNYLEPMTVDLGDFRQGIYYPQVRGDGVMVGATIVVSNQDNVNVLEVSSYGELTDQQLTDLTKLAVNRAR